MINNIGFPNLGIGEFSINRIAVQIGPVTVYWYGIIICIGMILGFSYLYLRISKFGLNLDNLTDIALVIVPSAVVGARLYYVLTSLEDFHSFYQAIAIWDGGIAIYGAVIAGALALYLVCKAKSFPVLKVFDAAAPSVMLGQIIGRWGNFVNAEAYGIIGRYDFLGISLNIGQKANPFIMSINGTLVHPTFLYESVWNLLGFVLINIFYNKTKFDGENLLRYLGWYGLGRSFIEGFRGDSLYIGNIRISQLIGLSCFVVSLALIFVLRARKAEGQPQ